MCFFAKSAAGGDFLLNPYCKMGKNDLPTLFEGGKTTKYRDNTHGICRCVPLEKPWEVNKTYSFSRRRIFCGLTEDMAKPTNFPYAWKTVGPGLRRRHLRRMSAWLLRACVLLYLHINIWWIFVFSIIFGGKSGIRHGNTPKNTAADRRSAVSLPC